MPTHQLTLFEEYLFHENRQNYPCNILIGARFKGNVDRSKLESAIHNTTLRHPLLTARVKKNQFKRLCWSLNATRKVEICWPESDPESFKPRLRPFNLLQENGFVFHIAKRGNRWSLWLDLNHAICDGAGAFLVLHDILLRYESLTKGNTIVEDSGNIPIPKLRSRYGLNFRKILKIIPAQLVGLLLSTTLLKRNVSAINPSARTRLESPLPDNSPHTVSKYLSKEEYKEFRRIARESKSSVNDLCLAYFHSAIGKWREREGINAPDDWIRISVPMNLRTKADKSLSACNAISIVSIDRRAKNLGDRKRLIRRAREDMRYVKKGDLAFVYLIILWIRRKMPGGIRKMSHLGVCRTSAVLTHVGNLFTQSPLRNKEGKLETGNSRLERITSIAPYRLHSHVTLLLGVYAGEFEMTLHYDARAIDSSQASELLDAFSNEIRQGV